jgi:8-oxo-dGTP pyrophosphatase MutT (NUDIX family)
MPRDTVEETIERFKSQLPPDDVSWLYEQTRSAQSMPPVGWENWQVILNGKRHHAGFMPSGRAQQMADWVSNVRKEGDLWQWDASDESLQTRSATLQDWLYQSHLTGDICDWRDELQDWIPDSTLHTTDSVDDGVAIGLRIERSGFRHLGLRSRAVHVNGFTSDGKLVVGLRSTLKKIDPGRFDNLMAGGISAGESWKQTFAREMMEEAGLQANLWPQVVCSGTIHTCRPEGASWHSETLIICHVVIPDGVHPLNQDGEVERFATFDAQEALFRMRAGQFTQDGVIALAVSLLS